MQQLCIDMQLLRKYATEAALTLRRHHLPKLRLPDAIILASARLLGCRLITRNTRDFPADSADVHVPYRTG